jgi:hypothetical protein
MSNPLRQITARVLPWIALLVISGCGPNARPHTSISIGKARRAAHLPMRIAQDLVVQRAEFGVFDTENGALRFTATHTIPPLDGQTYGWSVDLKTSRTTVHWQEHLQLPAPSENWASSAADPDVYIAKDGKSAVAQGDELVEDGAISRSYWTLATGDPPGEYSMDLAIEGKSVGHVVFHVNERVAEKPMLVDRRSPHSLLIPVARYTGTRPLVVIRR